MDLSFSDAEIAFRDDVREFIRGLFPSDSPYRGKPDQDRIWRQALRDRGWAAFRWPAEFGGTGWTPAQKYIWDRETGRAGLPPQPGGMGMDMLAPVLFAYGTPEQRARFLPDILAGRVTWCQGYSEPGAGSDLASLRTAAVRDGDHYVINGEKIWTSGAHRADWMFCLTRTSTEPKPQAGITFLLLDMKSPGVAVHPLIGLHGQHSFNRVTFDNVRTHVDNRIGEEGEGWRTAKGLLTHERTGQAYVSLSLTLLEGIRQVAGPRLDDPAFAARLAFTEVELRALEMTELRTLWQVAAGDSPGDQSSILKLKGTEIVQRLTEIYTDCAGAYAAPWIPALMDPELDVEPVGPRWAQVETMRYFEGRSASIAGGTDEVQRNIIAKGVLRI